MSETSLQLTKKQHAKYFQRLLYIMPSELASFDSARSMFAFFVISGLDVLNCLDNLSGVDKLHAIDWIYRLQINGAGAKSGFEASSMLYKINSKYRCGHLVMTYTGLATLLTLGDDLSRVDKDSIVEGIRACQNANGSFTAMVTGSESDMRFLYCACCISAILNDWSGINKKKAIDYILQSISFDGAIGQGPGLESHGGSTFCAVASLFLMDKLDIFSDKQLNKLKHWCLMRQDKGFQGRPNKPPDTCYSFWIGATLELLGAYHLSDLVRNREFILTMQDIVTGGFAKFDISHNGINTDPINTDPLHTYLGLCGLSLLGESDLQAINAALNISQRAFMHLQEIHKRWQTK